MGNFFDQYDPPVTAPPPAQGAPNFFDQYDPRPVPAAAAPTMPAPIGVDDYGTPIFDTSTPEGKAADADARRPAEKFFEGATFGMLPHIEAATAMLGGVPYAKGLQAARDYTNATSEQHPVMSGIMEGAGGILPTAAMFGAGGPLISAASVIPRIGTALGRAGVSAGVGALSAGGHDIGSGDTSNVGRDVMTGAATGAALSAGGDVVGSVLQAAPNMATGLYQGVRNIATPSGREGVAGQILREAGGDFQNQAARSPLPDLNLRVPQITGNPGLASLEDTLASNGALNSGPPGARVVNHVTPDQSRAVAASLVGSDAGAEPATLLNQAGARGTQAIQDANTALQGVERGLWNAPELQSVRLNGPGIAHGVSQDVAQFPASWRDAVTGPQNKLGSYLNELQELGPDASIPDINSVRSRLLGVARDAASGPQPDSVTAAAANRMAGSIMDHIGNDPAIAGTPPVIRAGVTELHSIPGEEGPPVPVQIGDASTPGTPPNAAPMAAFQRARDFTRQFNGAKGYNEFNAILHPNSQGNMQGNPERQFGQFFDPSSGTGAGLQRLQGLSDFTRQSGLGQNADELDAAARQYASASVLRQARAGNGLDAAGQPATNLSTLASTVNKLAPSLNGTPMMASLAPGLQASGNAAELLARPRASGGTNSATYERLRNNDLVSAIVGQSGSSALGAAAGGYAGYKAGEPFSVPAYASVPGGMMAGALMGRQVGPVLGRAISRVPGINSMVTGPTDAIQRQVWDALSNMPAYERAIATPIGAGPRLGQPGMTSGATRGLARALLEPATGGTGR